MPDGPGTDPIPAGQGPSTAPPPGVPSGGATPAASPSLTPGTGATPPLAGPATGAVQPQGLVAQAQKTGSIVLKLMNDMLQAYHPGDEQWKDLAESLKKLSKHFPAATSPMIPQPKMNTGNPASSMPMPQMAGGGNMSGGPLGAMAQRGPI